MRVLKLLCLAWVIILASACNKSNNTSKNAALKVNILHHLLARNLVNCKVYIKYNTLYAPAHGVYDDSAVAGNIYSDTMQTAVFNKLANGKYYLYGTGYDTSLPLSRRPVVYMTVAGGYLYSINSQAVQTVNLAVIEN